MGISRSAGLAALVRRAHLAFAGNRDPCEGRTGRPVGRRHYLHAVLLRGGEYRYDGRDVPDRGYSSPPYELRRQRDHHDYGVTRPAAERETAAIEFILLNADRVISTRRVRGH